jgi:hypothetical protein
LAWSRSKNFCAITSWLKDRTTLREVNGEYVEITTPYIDRHNDALQIYARRETAALS